MMLITLHVILSPTFPSNSEDFHNGYTYSFLSSPDCTTTVAAPILGRVGFITLLFQRNLTFVTVPILTSASM